MRIQGEAKETDLERSLPTAVTKIPAEDTCNVDFSPPEVWEKAHLV